MTTHTGVIGRRWRYQIKLKEGHRTTEKSPGPARAIAAAISRAFSRVPCGRHVSRSDFRSAGADRIQVRGRGCHREFCLRINAEPNFVESPASPMPDKQSRTIRDSTRCPTHPGAKCGLTERDGQQSRGCNPGRQCEVAPTIHQSRQMACRTR